MEAHYAEEEVMRSRGGPVATRARNRAIRLKIIFIERPMGGFNVVVPADWRALRGNPFGGQEEYGGDSKLDAVEKGIDFLQRETELRLDVISALRELRSRMLQSDRRAAIPREEKWQSTEPDDGWKTSEDVRRRRRERYAALRK